MAAWPNTDTMSAAWVAVIPALFATLPPEYQSRFWTAMQEGTVHQFRHVLTSSNATQQHSTPNAAAPGSGSQTRQLHIRDASMPSLEEVLDFPEMKRLWGK
jgi:hypothetical protein